MRATDASVGGQPPKRVHLVVILHGLFGSPKHVAYLATALQREWSAHSSAAKDGGDHDEAGCRVVVLVAKSNGHSFAHLYDGIDVCAARVVEEIDTEIARIEAERGKVERFSMVGYSLGGLVARYAIGLLDSRSVPVYNSRFSRLARAIGGNLLSRTGRQLYERDSFLPPPRFDPKGDEKTVSARRGEPLLKVMADPRYSFYRALAKFKRFDLFANTLNDRTVPFPAGGIEAHDPFAAALDKAREEVKRRGGHPDDPLDLRQGGLEIDLCATAPIVEAYQEVPVPSSSPPNGRRRPSFLRIRLPLILRPSTFALPRPVALLLIATLPIVYPIALLLVFSRSLLSLPQSSRRIRRARLKVDGGRDGWLAQVGLSGEEMAEVLGVPAAQVLDEVAPKGGGDQSTRSSTAGSETALLPEEDANQHQASSASWASPGLSTKAATDPNLSAAQVFQIEQLNALPNLHKHYVHLIDTIWAHGAIICRNPKHPAQNRTTVVDWWAERFEV